MNSEMAMMAQKNPDLAKAIKKADLVVPDGSGVIFYLKRRGETQQRIAGIELSASMIEKLGKRGKNFPICFYGGAPGVTEKAVQVWLEKLPNAHMIYSHGYRSESDLKQWSYSI